MLRRGAETLSLSVHECGKGTRVRRFLLPPLSIPHSSYTLSPKHDITAEEESYGRRDLLCLSFSALHTEIPAMVSSAVRHFKDKVHRTSKLVYLFMINMTANLRGGGEAHILNVIVCLEYNDQISI